MNDIYGYMLKDNIGLEGIQEAENERFKVAIAGEIENSQELAQFLNSPFITPRDSDILLALASRHEIYDIVSSIKGAPTFAILDKKNQRLAVYSGNPPMTIQICQEGFYIASTLENSKCQRYIELKDGEIARINSSKIQILDKRQRRVKPNPKPIPTHEHIDSPYTFNEEILCVSSAIKQAHKAMTEYDELCLKGLKISNRDLNRINRIIITGSENSYHIAKLGAYSLELLTDIECISINSAELMSTRGILDKETLVIAISHSGESLNTISAVKRALRNEAKIIAITDNESSYLGRICDSIINPQWDYSTGNYSLCSFQADYYALAMLGIYLGGKIGYMTKLHTTVTLKMAEILQGKLGYSTKSNSELKEVARELNSYNQIIMCGYGADQGIADEIAEKMRIIAKKSAFSMSLAEASTCCGQLENTIIIPIISNDADLHTISKHIRTIKELCPIIVFTTDSYAQELGIADGMVTVGESIPLFNPITLVTSLYQTTLLLKPEEKEESLVS